MKLSRISLRGWRNLAPVVLDPGPHATVLYGDNGQGKTNVLEALHYLAEQRSFRTRNTVDLIQRGEPAARIEAHVIAHGLDRRIEIELRPPQKIIRVDGKPARRDSNVLRGVSTVLFVPEDLLLPRAAPAARRTFLDRAIFGTDRGYWAEAMAFQRVLRSRNAILRQGTATLDLLATYDDELARTGARVITRRRALTAALAPRVSEGFSAIHGNPGATIRYRSEADTTAGGDEPAIIAALLAGLFKRRAVDQRRRFTGFGPHTDDLELLLGGYPARDHGSQGQLRSLVLALKLAELGLVEDVAGEPPLLLLDDVGSELDDIRRRKLFEAIAALSGQTLITVTDRNLMPELPGRLDFHVVEGRVERPDVVP